MNIIVAIDRNFGIGKDNHLLISIPEDLKYFKEKTMDKIVIMGKNTFDSLPHKKPLPNRTNIVLTHQDIKIDGVIVCHSIKDAINYVKNNLGYKKLNDIFFIGGESVYKEALPLCDTLYITEIDAEFEADRFFPDISKDLSWREVKFENKISKNGILFSFSVYKKYNYA